MARRTVSVDQFLADLDHPRMDEILRIKAIVLGSRDGITEHIKWNAPSYRYGGDDRVTFRLQPPPTLQLIFHRGAKPKETGNFSFVDNAGLLNWVSADRAFVTFRDMQYVNDNQDALAELVSRWLEATSDRIGG